MSTRPFAAPPLVIITHEFYPQRGGIATFCEEIARAAVGPGRPVEVWAPALPAGHPSESSWPFLLRRLPLRGSHDLSCQLKLARELFRQRHRLRTATVHLAEPGPMLALMWLQRLPGFRLPNLLLTFHGSEILRFHHQPVVRLLARRLIRRATRISVLTRFTEQLLLRHFPEAAGRIVLTPGALRTGFATTARPAPSRQRLVVLTVGRLHPRKGQMQTLQALQALPPERRARIEYWMAGSTAKPDYERSLHALAATSDLPVRFLGDLPDVELDAVYGQADIFALTSINHGRSVEGFGLVYLEASAHGLPVVGHAVGGVSEAVLDGQTGLLVSPDQPAGLTAAFTRLIDDPPLRQRLGQAGLVWARRHTWREAAAALFDPGKPVSSS